MIVAAHGSDQGRAHVAHGGVGLGGEIARGLGVVRTVHVELTARWTIPPHETARLTFTGTGTR